MANAILVGVGFLGRKVVLLSVNNISIPIIIAFMVVIVAITNIIKSATQGRWRRKKIKN